MVAQLVTSLDPAVIEAEAFCIYGKPQGNHLEQMLAEKNIKIHYIGKGAGFSAKAVWQLGHALRAFEPDVVHSHLYACVYAAPWILGNKRKMIHTVHSAPEIENRRPLRKWITTLLVKCGKMIPVAISPKNQEKVAAFYNIAKEKVPVINNPVVLERFYRCKERQTDECVFITVGRLTPLKNQEMMIKAFAKVQETDRPAKLVLVGSGESEAALRELVDRLNLNEKVCFAGYVQDVERYLAEADVFVLSSNYEGLPMSILEAMAAELPVISTDVGGISDIVTDNGILIPVGDTDALRAAMLQLMEDPELRSHMSQRAKAYAAQYDMDMIADQYATVYQRYGCKSHKRRKK